MFPFYVRPPPPSWPSPYHHHLLSTYYKPQCKHFTRRVILSVLLLTQVLLTYFNWLVRKLSLTVVKLPRTTQLFISLFVNARKFPCSRIPGLTSFFAVCVSLNTWHGRVWVRSTMLPLPFHLPTKVHGWPNEGLRWVWETLLPIIFIVRISPKILPHPCSSSFRTVLRPCYSRCTHSINITWKLWNAESGTHSRAHE